MEKTRATTAVWLVTLVPASHAVAAGAAGDAEHTPRSLGTCEMLHAAVVPATWLLVKRALDQFVADTAERMRWPQASSPKPELSGSGKPRVRAGRNPP